MNKFLTLLLVFVFGAATLTTNAAKYTTSKDKVVSLNPFALTWGYFNVQLEKKMGTNNSGTISLGYNYYWENWTGLYVGASYRWYLDPFEEGKKSLNGLSVGPRVDVVYWSIDSDYKWADYGSYLGITIGAEVSYKWVFGDGKWAVEPGFNFGIPLVKKNYGFSPQAYGWGVNLGYCF
jgi:hypothetical protein